MKKETKRQVLYAVMVGTVSGIVIAYIEACFIVHVIFGLTYTTL